MENPTLSTLDKMECIERTLLEIDALESIYDEEFSVLSKDAWKMARQRLESDDGETIQQSILCVAVTIINDEKKKEEKLTLNFRIPEGYPLVSAVSVSLVISSSLLSNAQQEELSNELNARAKELVGSEAILEVVQYAQDRVTDDYYITQKKAMDDNKQREDSNDQEQRVEMAKSNSMFSRRWIWVHHITNTSRRKDIIREARELHLGGYLKAGYPGVVVVEGLYSSCEDFCIWIKGNKSRPGGFGRNWGHHVRGQIDFDDGIRKLDSFFKELDDMKTLGELCKTHEIDNEFKQYILQHPS